jgi:hypothetical protein
MKAAMILVLSMVLGLGMSGAGAAEPRDPGAKAGKVESLGGGKTCDKCNRHKGGKMETCCCADMKDKMGMMQGGMDHDAMAERMQQMEARMDRMQKMMEQKQ